MHYYFKQEISTESVNSLVEKLEQAEGEINLYFSTNGGDSTAMSFLISFFNSVADRLTITLTNDVWSAGTQVLYEYKGKIKLDLDELDSVLFHSADRETYNFRKDSTICDTKILVKQDKEYNLKVAEKIKQKKLLTEKQLKDFLKGKDVVVYKEQFKNWEL